MLNKAEKQKNDFLMTRFLSHFKDNDARLKKYMELLLLKKDATPISYSNKESLRRIAVVLTTKCNLKCVWCHRNEKRFAKYLHTEMQLETLKKILPKLEGLTTLHYGGLGEPLLYPYLYEAITEAKKYIPEVITTTNGTLLNKEKSIRLAKAGLTKLEVSIDGFEGDANKKARGVDHQLVLNNLFTFAKATNIPIQINCVVSAQNYKALFNAVDILKDIKGTLRLHTIPLFMTNFMTEKGIKDIETKHHQELLTHWDKRIKELGLQFDVWPRKYETLLDPVRALKQRHNICFPVFEDPFINVFGHLSPCGRLQELSLGNIADSDFDEVWNGPKMIAWRQAQLNGNYCKHCQFECNMKNTMDLLRNNLS